MWPSARNLLVFFAIAPMLCAGCGSPAEVFLECPSPDGQFMATFFLIPDGNGTGVLATRLTLRRVQGWWQADAPILDLVGGYEVRVKWLDPRRLRVEIPDDARVARAEPVAWVGERLEVTYVKAPGSNGLLVPGGSVCLRDPPVP